MASNAASIVFNRDDAFYRRCFADYRMERHLEFPAVLGDFEQWMQAANEGSVHVVSVLTSQTSLPYIFGASIVTVLLPAIGDDFVFRGIIQNQLMGKSSNHHLAIWAAAIIFSLAHFHIYGLIPRVLFGALFGYA